MFDYLIVSRHVSLCLHLWSLSVPLAYWCMCVCVCVCVVWIHASLSMIIFVSCHLSSSMEMLCNDRKNCNSWTGIYFISVTFIKNSAINVVVIVTVIIMIIIIIVIVIITHYLLYFHVVTLRVYVCMCVRVSFLKCFRSWQRRIVVTLSVFSCVLSVQHCLMNIILFSLCSFFFFFCCCSI